MLTDWIYWLSQKHPEQLLALLWALLLADSPRYAFSRLLMVGWDMARDSWSWLCGDEEQENFGYCPSVAVVIAGYNEAETIEATMVSVWGTYPGLEIIVVDDGSEDGMSLVARRFARSHEGTMVLSRPRRSGKPSALNFGLAYAKSEVVVFVDADSHLAPQAIWRIIQPLRDPQVGAVSATVLARNPFTNLVTWLQAYEYLNTIFVGRQLMARLGILSIISGALGAYRREVLLRGMGADVELAEDFDMALRARKAGYEIAFVPYAQCFTNLPQTWGALIRQRLRWEESSVLRLFCRKHIDMAYFWKANFRWRNFFVLLEMWTFNVWCVLAIWAYAGWFVITVPVAVWDKVALTLYFGYVAFELIQMLSVLFYSSDLRRDLAICAVFPLAPFYQLLMFLLRSRALVEETFQRKSYTLNHIPRHVREATWHW